MQFSSVNRRQSSWRKRLTAVGVCSLLAIPATVVTAQPASAGAICDDIELDVALTAGGPADQKVSGTLCRPHYWLNGMQIDVLTHGSTYTRAYWDFTIGGSLYSYVDHAAVAGKATFAYDVVGSGASSHPDSQLLSVASDAYVLHQIIQNMWDRGYKAVNSVGHSLGSAIAIEEAAAHKDVSRLILTGWVHAGGPGGAILGANSYDATLDPKFAGQPFDGYLTTRPGIRGPVFYLPEGSSSAVVAEDERTKDIVSPTLRSTAVAQRSTPAVSNVSNQINAPVYTIIGTNDILLCGTPLDCTSRAAVEANEIPYYTSARSLTVRVMPVTGHDLALHYSAPLTSLAINTWALTTPSLTCTSSTTGVVSCA